MKIEKIKIKKKNKIYAGEIVWPSDLKSAIKLLGESEVWQAFKIGYKEVCKKRIMGEEIFPKRKRVIKIDLDQLGDEQMRDALVALAEEQAAQIKPPPSVQSPPPEVSHTDPTDYDETLKEAEVLISASAESFEEDWSRYLASRNS